VSSLGYLCENVNCGFASRTVEQLIAHLRKQHALDQHEVRDISLPSEAEFIPWRSKAEGATGAKFVKPWDCRKGKHGLYQTFWCSRSEKTDSSIRKKIPRGAIKL